jgi:hypothetical protein
MGIGKVLGSMSPVAGAITGKGAFGKGLTALADSGLGMLVPMSYLAGSQRDKVKAKRADREAEEKRAPGTTMKRGGKVKKMAKGGSTASKRADGCATKGKTKGRMV